MIQTFIVSAPLGQVDGDAAVSTLSTAMGRLTHLHPALRGAATQASEGVLTMTLRVAGRTRWHSSGDARKIASSMLHRVGIAASTATMQLQQTAPSLSYVTKEQQRRAAG